MPRSPFNTSHEIHFEMTASARSNSFARNGAAVLAVLVAVTLVWPATGHSQPPPAGNAAAADAAPDDTADPAADPDAAADEPAKEIPLLEREPFDRVTLDAANKNAVLEVFPLPFPGRRKPSYPGGPNLTVRLLEDEREYEVRGQNIARIDLFEELLLQEAERLRDAGQLDEAFDYYYFVRATYPNVTGLESSVNRYLHLDGYQLAREGRYHEAMGVIEELYARDPRYPSRPPLMEFLGGLMDRIVKKYIDEGDYASAQKLLIRIAKQYGADRPPSTNYWAQQLATLASAKRDEAREHIENERFHEALDAARQMMNIWPNVPGARELDAHIAQQYPLVTVGVLQPALEFDSRRLDNWGARRTGRLIRRTLVEFLRAGPEGGEYELSLGSVGRSNDQQRLILNLKQFSNDQEQPLVTGYEVSRRLLEMANPDSPQYMAAWGGVMKGVQVKDVMQVDVALRQPHVLPEALLRVPLEPVTAEEQASGKGNGAYEVVKRTENETHFGTKDFQAGGRLAEVVERQFESTQQALAALRQGEIDVVDRVFPADAARLRDDLPLNSDIVVGQYALPTIHMLLVNVDNPFLANRDFRRALVFGINREQILNQELLGNREIPGCRIISGPFAAGLGTRDPLAYAYDTEIEPRGYYPRLAKLLQVVAEGHVHEMAEKRGDPAPELKPLVLGHPSYEAARVACQAIAAQLKLIGIEIELLEFPPGVTRDAEGKVDLTYAEVAIWEPLVDARRLLGDDGLAAIDSAYIRRALRRLDEAQDWGEVRLRLLDLHRTAHDEVAVVPLWQMADSFVYRKTLRNLVSDSAPVWIYQNVDNWRVAAPGAAE